jgi:hypothetical protein
MNPIPLTITLRLGCRSRSVTARELGQAFGCPDAGRLLLRLLLHPQDANEGREPTERGALSLPETVNDVLEIVTVREERGSKGEEGAEAVDDSEALASFLADRLHDWRSLGFYRNVARRLPERVVRDALTRCCRSDESAEI